MTTLLERMHDEPTVYLHLSQRHLQAAPNPLEQLQVSAPVVLPRSRLKRKPSPTYAGLRRTSDER